MNELKLVIKQTGNSYTLKPTREYAIGSSPDCDICLLNNSDLSSFHAKFSFDEFDKTWYIYDLGSSAGTFVGKQRINDYPILNKTQITLGSEIYLIATPVGGETITQVQQGISAPPPLQIYYSEPSSYPTTMPATTPQVISSTPDRKLIRSYFECLKKRNNAPKESETIGIKIIKDLFSSLKKSSWPQGYGIIAVPFLVIVLFALLAQEVGWAIFLIIAGVVLSFITVDIPPNLPTPPVTDEQILKWLEMDLEKLVEKGQVELRIMTTTGDDLGNILDGEPITLMSGVSEKLDKSSLLELVRFLDMVKRDYFVESGMNGKTQYSIYDFLAIYPCKNFIAYYRCKWNFIRGVSLKDETCEYMYDSIVSVKTWEDSVSSEKKSEKSDNADRAVTNQERGESLNFNANLNAVTNQEEGKEVNFEVFEITTTDGKSILFPVLQDSRLVTASETFNFEKMPHSKARDAAYLIRQQVRQRKPGFIKTQSVNEMRKSLLED